MGTTEWTVIGTGIALFAALGVLIRLNITALRNELKGSIAELRAELKEDIANLRGEVKGDLAQTDGRVARLEVIVTRMESDLAWIKDELARIKDDVANLRLAVQANRAEIIATRRMLSRFGMHRHDDSGQSIAPLADTLDPPDVGNFGNGEGSSD